MKGIFVCVIFAFVSVFFLLLSGCSTYSTSYRSGMASARMTPPHIDYAARLPQSIDSQGKVVVVDPRVHAWGAYANGGLVKGGLATAGSPWCSDTKRPCRTSVGSFRIFSLGSPNCKSNLYPVGRGGAPMPYCMFFHGAQALHGSPSNHVVDDNISHGCVRMNVSDAEWLRYNFATVGTKVIVRPY